MLRTRQLRQCFRALESPAGMKMSMRGPSRQIARSSEKAKLADVSGPRRPPSESTAVKKAEEKLKVLSLVASCVQINSDLARFERLAGRSAMVAFAIAFVLESVMPEGGVFNAWDLQGLSQYILAALSLVTCAGALATQSRRPGGVKFQQTVISSILALTRSASSLTQKNIDCAVDYVFEQVFGPQFVDANLLDIDDFI